MIQVASSLRAQPGAGVTAALARQLVEEAEALVHEHIRRRETRGHAVAYMRGLLEDVERKNSWQLAEQAGHRDPYAFQHLLGRAVWDADGLRDALLGYVGEQMGRHGGVLVVDETGFLKKGDKSAGVARQYSGTAGRIENCQIGVFLAYAKGGRAVLMDRSLYLPKEWMDDPERCAQADIPDDIGFRTKPQLGQAMLVHAFEAGFAPDWVVADEVYGRDGSLRRFLEQRDQAYVLAVATNTYVWKGFRQYRADHMLDMLPPDAWQLLSAGSGSKGPRVYEWSSVGVNALQEGGQRSLLFRRPVGSTDKKEIAYYLVYSPRPVALEQVVQAAGSRWTIESCFEAAKGEVGLDQYEVRSYVGWYRHITFAMLAHALLVSGTARANGVESAAPASGGDTKKGRRHRRPSMVAFRQSRGLLSR